MRVGCLLSLGLAWCDVICMQENELKRPQLHTFALQSGFVRSVQMLMRYWCRYENEFNNVQDVFELQVRLAGIRPSLAVGNMKVLIYGHSAT